MQNIPKQPSKEQWIVIGLFVLMVFLCVLTKGLSHGIKAEMCRTPDGCSAYNLNGGGMGVIFSSSFWMMMLAFVGYGVAFIAEVLFLISSLTRKCISPYLAIALGLSVCVLSYIVIT